MTSPLLALFTRSLREDTRSRATYWARAGLAAFILVVIFITAMGRSSGGAPGLRFLETVVWLQTVFLTIAGLGYFASAITEEKEEEMLGLLRMTNLSPLSILLGKSTSRLAGALLLIGAQLPFTMMAATLGGVSPGQVFAAYAALGAYAFLLCNLALLASVLAPRTGIAAVITGAVLCAVTLGQNSIYELRHLSPFRRVEEIFNTGFQDSPISFQVVASVALGLILFFLAWLLFERMCGGRTSNRPSLAAAFRRAGRRWFAPGRPEPSRALAWKDFHFLHGGGLVRTVKLVAGAVVLALGFINMGEGRKAGGEAMGLCGIGLVWLIAEAGFAASRICACEVRDRTLSSLAVLPQSLRLITAGKVACRWRVLAPALMFLGVSLLATCFIIVIEANENHAIEAVGIALFYGSIFVWSVFGMSYLGVHLTAYLSLRMKRGALPLAIIICLASSVFIPIPCLGWFGVPGVAMIIGHNLRTKIFQRLDELAAED